MWKHFCSLFKKDCQMMISGKFFLLALGSLLLYTLFINFGYVKFMKAELYHVYLYDPQGTQRQVSGMVFPVTSLEELDKSLATDTTGVGIDASSGTPNIILYYGSEKVDRHRADYARSLLHPDNGYTAKIVGTNTPELKQRKEISCELLFIEIVAVGFLGIASVLFKEKQMGVIRVHAVLPLKRSLFILSKIAVFLLSDLLFAALMTICNVGFTDAIPILPAILVQTAILSLIMALAGFGCTMLLNGNRYFCSNTCIFGGEYFHKNEMDRLASILSNLYGIEKCLFWNTCHGSYLLHWFCLWNCCPVFNDTSCVS